MKNLKAGLIAIFVLFLAQTALSQNKFAGRVVDVIDGRTVVIELLNGRVTAILQNIEVPEAGQPLNREVVEHLRQLVLGKVVIFQARVLMPTKTVGRLIAGDVDISQQMIRDGAAWLAPVEATGQGRGEREDYQASEGQAKADKLGVWSIKGLKPAWEYRAEKLEIENRKKAAELDAYRKSNAAATNPTPGRPRTQATASRTAQDVDLWADIMSGRDKESVGLITNYDTANAVGMVATSAAFVSLVSGDTRQKLEFRTLYLYKDWQNGSRESVYLIGFLATSEDYRFARSTSLTVFADRQRLALGQAKRFSRQTAFGSQELLFYLVSRKTINAIAKAKKLDLKIGTFSGPLGADSQRLMRQLLDVSQ